MGTILSILLYWVHEWLHAYLVTAIIFLQVVDIELDSVTFTDVSDREKVPLTVRKRVVIELKVHIILAFADLFNFSQVAWFKLRVEKDCLVIDVFNIQRLRRIN